MRRRGGEPLPRWAERWDEIKPAAFRVAREVLPGLYQIRTLGSRAYLVDDNDITLVDTGGPGSGIVILRAIEELGRSPEDVKQIVITHCHIDHIGALPEIQQWLPARTAVHFAEAPEIQSDEPLRSPFVHPLLARICEPYLLRVDPGAARVDLLLRDGDELPGLGGIRVVHAPGHTPGSISLHFPDRGALIVGDAMQYKFGRLMLPNRAFTQDMTAAAESVRKLSQLEFDTLCFSHFRPILRSADEKLRAFARTLAS